MQTYSIADLEKLSGIKSHTIRIWEKRYNIVSPERTDTNIRAYNDDQLKKILNISFLINNGLKISKIASLSLDELSSKVLSLTSSTDSFEAQINDFVICSLQFDEPLFENTYNGLRKNHTLSYIYENIFIPTLRRIGALWSSGELFPAQEHFLSNLIKQKFYHAIEDADSKIKMGKKAYLFLPPWEDHDFALLYSNMVLKENGFDVVNVGKTISFDSILQCIEKIKPDILFTTFIVGQKVTLLQKFCDDLHNHSKTKLFFAGNPDLLRLVNTHGKVFYSLDEFDRFFNNSSLN
ncbi:MAG: MerR family transcriptional regulator [Flavobacteriales bacterium]|jgi:DNA-binding transcriptional MerR regulator|nr:MerR family transcriptional regulator [Flavobacteriales bacterium]MDG1439406.1 MerR family transcriptional regulator [Flavobacteriales bacterium]MDG1798160.1 MerR family transcriptional regulator [Flavobacteriales bacterium]